LGIGNSSLLSPERREALKERNNCYLYKSWAKASLGFITNKWKSSGDLDLIGNLVVEWIAYYKALIHSGIQLQSKEESLILTGGDHSGVINDKNVYNALAKEYWSTQIIGWQRQFWNWDLARKIKLFMWLALENKILTWDNLIKEGWEGPSLCYLCHRDEDTVFHIFVSCTFSQKNWFSLSTVYNFATIWGGSILTLFYENWLKLEKYRSTLPELTCYIWLPRNNCIF
jgi:hypothetical protein